MSFPVCTAFCCFCKECVSSSDAGLHHGGVPEERVHGLAAERHAVRRGNISANCQGHISRRRPRRRDGSTVRVRRRTYDTTREKKKKKTRPSRKEFSYSSNADYLSLSLAHTAAIKGDFWKISAVDVVSVRT